MIVISDSTPLIHFGTIKRLDLLRSIYGRILITEAVHREVVTEGIALGKMDALLIEKEIGTLIEVVNPKGYAGEICSRYRIHIGEAESILLAQELNAGLLLINERDGRQAAKNAGIKVKGTIGVISDCVGEHLLTIGEAAHILYVFRDNPSEFWIDPNIIDMGVIHEEHDEPSARWWVAARSGAVWGDKKGGERFYLKPLLILRTPIIHSKLIRAMIPAGASAGTSAGGDGGASATTIKPWRIPLSSPSMDAS